MKRMKLTPPVHAIPLKRNKLYCGRIAWDATGDSIHFIVEVAKRKSFVPRRITVPIFSEEKGDILGVIDMGSRAQLVVAKLSFDRKPDEFEHNYYHSEFASEVHEHIENMLKTDIGLKESLEKALSS